MVEKAFTDRIKLKILRWETILAYPRGLEEEEEREMWLRKKRRRQQDRRGRDGSRVSHATHQGTPAATRRQKMQGKDSLLKLWREPGPVDTLVLAQWNWFWTSGLQSHERRNVCSFKPPGLWSFVKVDTGNEYICQPTVYSEKSNSSYSDNFWLQYSGHKTLFMRPSTHFLLTCIPCNFHPQRTWSLSVKFHEPAPLVPFG